MIHSCKKPPVYFPTVTGDICSFNSQYAGLPLKSHKIALTATQSGSGTPSPDNVRPISGADSIHIQNTCGINQWDEQWEVGTYNTSGQKATDNRMIRSKNYIAIKPNTTYYVWSANVAFVYFFYDIDKNFISSNYLTNSTFTSPANAYYMNFRTSADYGNVYHNDISINYPSTDTSYHAFVGQSATIQIGSTVYGGYYDARTGVLTVTHGFKTINDLTGFDSMSTPSDHVFRARASDLVGLEYVSRDVPTNAICSHFDAKAYGPISARDNGKFAISDQSTNRIVFVAHDYSTVSDFLEAIGTAQIAYPLATPTTIQLPPCLIDTLEGVNNIFADCGNTTLEYLKAGR